MPRQGGPEPAASGWSCGSQSHARGSPGIRVTVPCDQARVTPLSRPRGPLCISGLFARTFTAVRSSLAALFAADLLRSRCVGRGER